MSSSRHRGRGRFDVTSGKPSRGYVLFVFVMAGFLVIGSVALVIGTAFLDDGDGSNAAVDTRPGEEIARLETAVANDPGDVGSMTVLANILATSGRLNEAVGWYERAVNADPNNGDLRTAFGIALFEQGSDFDARIQFRRAHELIPDSATPPFYLGWIAERSGSGSMEEARLWYEEAIQIAPDSLVAQQAEERLAALDAPTVTPTP